MNQDHSQRTHALLGGSKVKQAMLCPASVLLQEQYPEQEAGEAALRGTAIHEIAESLLAGNQPLVGDDEMIAIAQGYVDAVREQTPHAKRTLVEHNVTEALSYIHPSLGGNIDLVAIGGGEMLVCDLKTGRSIVPVENNPQLLTYALGAAMSLKAPDNIRVRLAIYQPAQGGWNEWVTDMKRLDQWRDELVEIAVAAGSPDAPMRPSSEACQWCRAKSGCPALKAKALAAAAVEFNGHPITPELLDQAELAGLWVDSVKDAAKRQLIDNPKSIPGWRMKAGRKMVTWKDHAMAELAMKEHPDAWTLKSASAVMKLTEVPPGLINETTAAASLSRSKE